MSFRHLDTLRHLRPVQIAYRLRRAARSRVYRAAPGLLRGRLERRVPPDPGLRSFTTPVWDERPSQPELGMFSPEALERGEFRFLNRAKTFPGRIAWSNPDQSYLWDFNLHYFEFIHAVAARPRGLARVHGWMREWVEANPYAREPGWHPYTTSLRIINWVRLLLTYRPSGGAQDDLLRSLYAQLLFLERNLEKHLMANHYLENGRALLFGGCLFAGPDGDRWRDRGARIVAAEIAEEFLPQGGHFERSPMYHCILLEGLLDTALLLRAAGTPPEWTPALLRMCDWLWKIQTPDGWYPLFNDAAFGISAPPDHLLDIARRRFAWAPPREAALQECDRVCVMRTPSWYCAVDGAEIGPSYNPGHAHSDNFTYELFFQGKPVVVDRGTHHYDLDEARLAERRTAAHNTVIVNGIEQSDVWGSFRVGRRSNPSRVSWLEEPNGALRFDGEFKNGVRPRADIRHRRSGLLDETLGWVVSDTITGRDALRVESFLHCAPGWMPEFGAGGWTLRNGDVRLHLCHTEGAAATVDDYDYAPQFGRSIPAKRVTLSQAGDRRVRMGYAVSPQKIRELRFGPEGDLVCEPETAAR